jgi:hypothetical protein
VTTGLLSAVDYLKDNRLLPRGFDKKDAPADIAVHGQALKDPAFSDRGHTLRYSIGVRDAAGPFEIAVELWYQPIGFRWAKNLAPYNSDETNRFTAYFDSMGPVSATLLVKVTIPAQSAPNW